MRTIVALALLLQAAQAGRAHADDRLAEQCSEAAFARDPSTAEQRRQHCQAAQSSQEGADSNASLAKVWGAVAGVCAAACATSVAGGPTNELVCQGSQVAGSATDAAVTREFSGALQGIVTTGGQAAVNRYKESNAAAEAAASGKQPKKKEKDVGACLAAATAGVQTYSKYGNMKNAESAARASVDALGNLGGAQSASALTAGEALPGGAPAMTDGASGTVARALEDAGDPASPARLCRAARRGRDPGATLRCAVARDPSLPAFVQSPKFPTEFQKATGQNLADFLKREDSPRQLLGGVMGAGLGPTQSAKLAAALGSVEQQLAQGGVDGAAYASAGGGFDSGNDPAFGDQALEEMMAGLAAKLAPQKEGEEPQPGIATVIFANNRYSRNPAAIAENPALSLFDRVTYRYYFVAKRIFPTEGEAIR